MNKKKKTIIIIIAIIVAAIIMHSIFFPKNKIKLKTIKSEKELYEVCFGEDNRYSVWDDFLDDLVMLPFYVLEDFYYGGGTIKTAASQMSMSEIEGGFNPGEYKKEFSKTNTQEENVDEADVTKTDGDYIYSLSGKKVVITNVKDPENIEISAQIKAPHDSEPIDLMLYKNKLVIIYNNSTSEYGYNYRYSSNNTIVRIYNVESKTSPKLEKSFELYEPYYTSRCVNNTLYVISSGTLRKKSRKEVERGYIEDEKEKEVPLDHIQYMDEVEVKEQTLITATDLNNLSEDIKINSYLMSVENAYVSEKSIYLLDGKEGDQTKTKLKKLFGLGGILGYIHYEDEGNDVYGKTIIYKFDIHANGTISYAAGNKVEGETVNQYSLDEHKGNLRIATYNTKGTKVTIFNEKMKKIGETENVARGERMYATRFMDDRAYLVTYYQTDPLFVVDLSNEKKPEILGELHIPGYSTYLHPYDENHLIGIGLETEGAYTIGMKMALFDVSDVKKPIQISETIIGDERTTSAILTNPKALLFSKEKNLLAIPVNDFNQSFKANTSDNIETAMSYYTYYYSNYDIISEGYLVYNIDLRNGFELKGVITHKNNNYDYNYYNNSNKNRQQIRGLYIENNLYTITAGKIKVHDLETLEPVSELKIKKN